MKTWAETIQDCIDNKWTPELGWKMPNVSGLLRSCKACDRAWEDFDNIDRKIQASVCDCCPIKAVSRESSCSNTPYMTLHRFWRDLCESEENLFGKNLEEVKEIIQKEIEFLEGVKQFCIDTNFGEKS